jgi:hypothetical protein
MKVFIVWYANGPISVNSYLDDLSLIYFILVLTHSLASISNTHKSSLNVLSSAYMPPYIIKNDPKIEAEWPILFGGNKPKFILLSP